MQLQSLEQSQLDAPPTGSERRFEIFMSELGFKNEECSSQVLCTNGVRQLSLVCCSLVSLPGQVQFGTRMIRTPSAPM